MNKTIKNSIILCVITLVSGLLLGGVYEITKEARAEQGRIKKENAYKDVLKDADEFESIEMNSEEIEKYLADKGLNETQVVINEIAKAKSKGTEVGYAITVTDKEGYGGNIQFTVGISQDGTVKGLSILSISETAGLGMKAAEEDFLNQFSDKLVPKFKYRKNNKASKEEEIDAIGGATITTNAVVNGTNAAIYCFEYLSGNEVSNE